MRRLPSHKVRACYDEISAANYDPRLRHHDTGTLEHLTCTAMPRFGSTSLPSPNSAAPRAASSSSTWRPICAVLASLAFSRRGGAGCRAVDFRSVHVCAWRPVQPSPTACASRTARHAVRAALAVVFGRISRRAFHNSNWVTSLYAFRYGNGRGGAWLSTWFRACCPLAARHPTPLYGCLRHLRPAGAIGLLYGDVQFLLFPLPIGIKARYLVANIRAHRRGHALWPGAPVRVFALGGALAGLLYVRWAPRRRAPVRAQRELVRPAQRLLPLKRRRAAPQIPGLHAISGAHRQVRRPGTA